MCWTNSFDFLKENKVSKSCFIPAESKPNVVQCFGMLLNTDTAFQGFNMNKLLVTHFFQLPPLGQKNQRQSTLKPNWMFQLLIN